MDKTEKAAADAIAVTNAIEMHTNTRIRFHALSSQGDISAMWPSETGSRETPVASLEKKISTNTNPRTLICTAGHKLHTVLKAQAWLWAPAFSTLSRGKSGSCDI